MNHRNWTAEMKKQVKKILDENGFEGADRQTIDDICDLFRDSGCGSHEKLTKLALDYCDR